MIVPVLVLRKVNMSKQHTRVPGKLHMSCSGSSTDMGAGGSYYVSVMV